MLGGAARSAQSLTTSVVSSKLACPVTSLWVCASATLRSRAPHCSQGWATGAGTAWAAMPQGGEHMQSVLPCALRASPAAARCSSGAAHGCSRRRISALWPLAQAGTFDAFASGDLAAARDRRIASTQCWLVALNALNGDHRCTPGTAAGPGAPRLPTSPRPDRPTPRARALLLSPAIDAPACAAFRAVIGDP